MARIRSIKPEFFTSETIAALPLSARLTFIGLWTYVDDNGVGLDNERLILAAVWPLEEDVTGTVQMTREDLRSLSRARLVTRYTDGRHRLIHISSWEEHQKVSHPRKPRYPLPGDPSTCIDDAPESLGRHSGGFPEPLRPEQGAGSRELSREQGAGNPPVAVINSNVEGSAPKLATLPTEPWRNGYLEPNGAPASRRSQPELQRQQNALTEWERANGDA